MVKLEPSEVTVDQNLVKFEPSFVKLEPLRVDLDPPKVKSDEFLVKAEPRKVKLDQPRVKVERDSAPRPVERVAPRAFLLRARIRYACGPEADWSCIPHGSARGATRSTAKPKP